jgi:hypothetical protein
VNNTDDFLRLIESRLNGQVSEAADAINDTFIILAGSIEELSQRNEALAERLNFAGERFTAQVVGDLGVDLHRDLRWALEELSLLTSQHNDKIREISRRHSMSPRMPVHPNGWVSISDDCDQCLESITRGSANAPTGTFEEPDEQEREVARKMAKIEPELIDAVFDGLQDRGLSSEGVQVVLQVVGSDEPTEIKLSVLFGNGMHDDAFDAIMNSLERTSIDMDEVGARIEGDELSLYFPYPGEEEEVNKTGLLGAGALILQILPALDGMDEDAPIGVKVVDDKVSLTVSVNDMPEEWLRRIGASRGAIDDLAAMLEKRTVPAEG